MADKSKKYIRLDKCLTINFDISRKEAGRLIRQGAVTVNEEVVKDASFKVTADDVVHYDGNALTSEEVIEHRYFMLNKPAGYVCVNEDSTHPTVFMLLDESVRDLFCVGRLDLDTTGLLLITDDGQWAHRITSPRHHCCKTYQATLAEPCTPEIVDLFAKGVQLKGEMELTKPATLKIINPTTVQLTIQEGKYHQVKRMFAAVGNKVCTLSRLSIGELTLDPTLESGAYRKLTAEEIALLNAKE